MTEATISSSEGKRVLVAGQEGKAGSTILRRRGSENCEILTADLGHLDMTHRWEGRGLVGRIHL
jgi:hypothetical protein